jgi:hypothetical protein
MLPAAFLRLSAALLLSSGLALAQAPQPPASPDSSQKNSPINEQALFYVLDGFAWAGPLDALNRSELTQVAVFKGDAAALARAQRQYRCPAGKGIVWLYSNLPLVVGQQVLRTDAEKQAAAKSARLRYATVQLLPATEAARYGLSPGTRALRLTRTGKKISTAPRLPTSPPDARP